MQISGSTLGSTRYKESEDCADWSVGCKQDFPVTGHFTALIWKGVTSVGCGISASKGVGYCHYRGGKELPLTPDNWCYAPNMGTNFAGMVQKPSSSRSAESCEALAKSCGDDAPSSAVGTFELVGKLGGMMAVGLFVAALVRLALDPRGRLASALEAADWGKAATMKAASKTD